MNRTTTALLVAAGLSLTACSSDPDLTPTIHATPAPAVPDEAEFRAEMQANGLVPKYGTSGEITELGQTICDSLAMGRTPNQIQSVGVQSGITATDAELVVAAAATHLCPEHADKLEN